MLPEVKNSRAYGNEEVVEMLRAWLKTAEEGLICHATITAQQMPNLMACAFAGSADLEYAIPHALDTLKLKIAEQQRLHTGPPLKEGFQADRVVYNIADSPLSFDFLPWLIAQEMTRVREGAPAPLRVAFTMGQDGKGGLNNSYRRTMFVNVVQPLLYMIGAVEDQGAIGGRSPRQWIMSPVTVAARAGEPVPRLKPSVAAMEHVGEMLNGTSPVTITLRELDTWAHRNSNLPAWLRFADDLKAQGHCVIFLRDTAKAGEPLLGYDTCPIASTTLAIRLALYEQAKFNFFVPNGPWNLALFGTKPWTMFNQVRPDDPFHCNRPEFWRDSQGIEAGTQFPWSLPNQRIVWEADTYEAITKAWKAFNG